MPTYEYVCDKCGHEFEITRSMSEPTLTRCPKELCAQKRWGKGKVRKLVGLGAGLIFKGSGFYITDYRSEKYKEAAKKDVPAASGADNKAAKPAAGESKPAPKTESKPAKPAKATE